MRLRRRTSGVVSRTAQQAGVTGRQAVCPSCERFIGPADHCPYCGADAAGTWSLRLLRYGALTLAVGGVVFLVLAARGRTAPMVQASDVTPLMNFAYVRVQGTVVRDAYLGRNDGRVDYLSFALDDGSARIRVKAYGDTARDLHEQGMAPGKGDRVEATGNLSVSWSRDPALRLQAVEQLRPIEAGREAGASP